MKCACGEEDIERLNKVIHIRHKDILVRISNTPVEYCYDCGTTIINGVVAKRMSELARKAYELGDDLIEYSNKEFEIC